MTRVVTWNCNLALQRKLPHLMSLAPDIAIVQECERELTAPPGFSYRWLGDNPRKGLGVLARTDFVLYSGTQEGWTYFLPVEITALRLRLVAVWAFNHRAEDRHGPGRIGSARTVASHLAPWLSEGRSLMVGDFNNAIRWDRPGGEYNFQDVADVLHSVGLRSAYHSFGSVPFGAEPVATYFHTKNPNKPYHIDFCFVHDSLAIRDVRVGEYTDWREFSDHVPMLVEIHDA